MSNQPFSFTTQCPNCGGKLVFQSTASVMGVCSYCQTTVSRSAEVIEQHGKISQILEDFSPLQIGSSGVYKQVPFTVVGRLQMRFDAGQWFEWHIMFADGRVGWLSESDGTYSITEKVVNFAGAPAYHDIYLDAVFSYNNIRYSVSDLHQPVCIGGEGELPYMVSDSSRLQVCDARNNKQLISLDYGEVSDTNDDVIDDNRTPTIYVGENVSLEELNMKFLRDAHSIAASAGNIDEQQNNSTECPNCGDSLDFVTGMAEHVVCRSCFSQIKVSDDQAKLIEIGDANLATYRTTLSIGDTANIHGHTYTIIGTIGYQEIDDEEYSTWVDYLLYSASNHEAAFFWLTEAYGEWSKSTTVLDQPEESGDSVYYNGNSWERIWAYQAKVSWALGAFYWQVKMDDVSDYEDFGTDEQRLIKETGSNDIIWNHAESIPNYVVAGWFGIEDDEFFEDDAEEGLSKILTVVLAILWIINLPITLFFHGSWWVIIFASIALLVMFYQNQYGNEEKESHSSFGFPIWSAIIIVIATFMNITSKSNNQQSYNSPRSGFGTGTYHK